MRLVSQSVELQNAFKAKVKQKVSRQQEKIKDKFNNDYFASFVSFGTSLQQSRNNFIGNLGELSVSVLLNLLPHDWVMFKNALIPTTNGNLTEIDLLIVGSKGIFLIEVKTWRGAFCAYQDRWKMKQNNQWIPLQNSPSRQSLYHLDIFSSWLKKNEITIADCKMYAPVVFNLVKWLGITDCCVPIFKNQIELLKYIKECPDCLSKSEIEIVSSAIENCKLKLTNNISKNSTSRPKQKPILRKKSQF